jgi:hypothetical protein
MTIQAPKYVETFKARGHNMLAKKIHQTLLAIDSELIVAVDGEYRNRLVKVAYALRNLEESMHGDRRPAKHLTNSKIKRAKSSSARNALEGKG